MKPRLVLFLVPFLLVILLFFSFRTYQSSRFSLAEVVSSHKDTNPNAAKSNTLFGFATDSLNVVKASFRANENLGEILTQYNVSAATIAAIGHLPRDVFDVRKLQANKPYTIIHKGDSSQTARCFVYEPNPIDYVILDFEEELDVRRGRRQVDTLEQTIAGTITTSLYESVLDAGGSPVLVSELSDVYAWVIDFFGLQGGDCYKIIYTTYEVNGKEAGFGGIKAASFTHMGKEMIAIAFDQGSGVEYFDEYGNSLRKTFLKAPLKFSRISSRFSYSRLHPVLKYRRPHLGVDYAAPRGTPVQSVGSGVVVKAGYSGGAGHMIKVRHNSNYTTAYLHLSRYAKGITAGAKVEQGQIIGYVGSTGLSTGPHLDFRFYKNGVPVDPLKVDPPSSDPIQDNLCDSYMQHRDIMIALLEKVDENKPGTLFAAR